MNKTVQAGTMKLALGDIDQAILKIQAVQRDLGTNAVLDHQVTQLQTATANLHRFADRLRD